MRLISAFLFLFVFLVAGCATGAKKQTTQAPAATYEKPQKTYQPVASIINDDEGKLSKTYNQPIKKGYVVSNEPLSVKQIQRALKSAGFYQGPIDGNIGPKTKEAIIKFQKAKGLKADGIVGKRTSAELNRYLSR